MLPAKAQQEELIQNLALREFLISFQNEVQNLMKKIARPEFYEYYQVRPKTNYGHPLKKKLSRHTLMVFLEYLVPEASFCHLSLTLQAVSQKVD